MPELAYPKILFLVPLLFVASIPTYFLNFQFFNHSSKSRVVYSTCHSKSFDLILRYITKVLEYEGDLVMLCFLVISLYSHMYSVNLHYTVPGF